MIYRIILYAIISSACYVVSLKWANGFRYEDYKDYLTLLSSVSGMVFTIMGIWIAFLYPNAMSRIVNPEKVVAKDFSEFRSDAKRLESIVGAVMASALVMVAALFVALLKIVFFLTPLYVEYRLQIKAAAFATLVFITIVQLESVFYVVLSNIMFINDLHFKRQTRQADQEL